MKESLSIFIYGPTKTGKSTLSFTADFPLLVLDAEGSTKFISRAGWGSATKARKIAWNPQEPPPVDDGTWDVCVVNALNWQSVNLTVQHLRSGKHPFRSLSIDSITEIQRKCKANLNVSQMQQQDWGRLLEELDKLIRGCRDISNHPTNPLSTVVFIAEEHVNKVGQLAPYMQGQVANSAPYWVDVLGYLSQESLKDENGQDSGKRTTRLIISPNPRVLAGERVQGKLPPVIANPNISSIFTAIYQD